MPDRRDPLTPERLAALLATLDDVMAEAARLRREVTRQLADQRQATQQRVTSARKKLSKRR
jgi:hypothetical protein